MTKSEYAKHRGVHPSRISHLITAKRVVVLPDGRVDVDASDRLIDATTDYARKPASSAAGSGFSPAEEAPKKRGRPAARDGAGRSYQDNRRDLELWKARSSELAYRKEAGELVEWESVQKALAQAIGPIMARLEGLPARICRHVDGDALRKVQMAAERDVQEIRREAAAALRAMAEDSREETRQ